MWEQRIEWVASPDKNEECGLLEEHLTSGALVVDLIDRYSTNITIRSLCDE